MTALLTFELSICSMAMYHSDRGLYWITPLTSMNTCSVQRRWKYQGTVASFGSQTISSISRASIERVSTSPVLRSVKNAQKLFPSVNSLRSLPVSPVWLNSCMLRGLSKKAFS